MGGVIDPSHFQRESTEKQVHAALSVDVTPSWVIVWDHEQVASDNPGGNTPSQELPSPASANVAGQLLKPGTGLVGTGTIDTSWLCPAGIKVGEEIGVLYPTKKKEKKNYEHACDTQKRQIWGTKTNLQGSITHPNLVRSIASTINSFKWLIW